MIKKYKLKNGEARYQVVSYLGLDPITNKQVQKRKSGFKTEREAKTYEARLLLKIEEEGLPAYKTPKTYEEVYELWLESDYKDSVKESTLQKTTRIFSNHILPAYGDMQIDKINPVYCQQVVNEWKKQMKSFSVTNNYASKVFDYAIRMKMIKEDNPFKAVVIKQVVEDDFEIRDDSDSFYTKDELNEFLECVNNQLAYRWYAYFVLLSYSGMRKGEALALEWSDIDFENENVSITKTLTTGLNNRLVVQTTKTTNGRRMIDLDKQTLNILKKWKLDQATTLLQNGINANDENQLIFSTLNNEHISLATPYNRLKSVQKKNNLKQISVHQLRHTHCSLLFESGASIKEVQDRLGHTDIQTTMNIYAHVSKHTKKKIANNFAKFMGN